MIVSIQFCGGCNARIDRARLARALTQSLESKGFRVVFNTTDADHIIFLSGCKSGCAVKYNPTDRLCTVVAGTTVDSEEVEEAQIASVVLEKIFSSSRAFGYDPGGARVYDSS